MRNTFISIPDMPTTSLHTHLLESAAWGLVELSVIWISSSMWGYGALYFGPHIFKFVFTINGLRLINNGDTKASTLNYIWLDLTSWIFKKNCVTKATWIGSCSCWSTPICADCPPTWIVICPSSDDTVSAGARLGATLAHLELKNIWRWVDVYVCLYRR